MAFTISGFLMADTTALAPAGHSGINDVDVHQLIV